MKINLKTWLLLGLLLCSAAIIFAARVTSNPKTHRHVPFTITLKAEDRYDDGRIVEAFTETRFVSSTGNWRSVRHLPNGASIERVAVVGRGIFTVDAQARKLWLNSPYPGKFPEPGERHRSSNYVRAETVLNYLTDVIRLEADGKFVELYQAPNLNGFVIKQVEQGAGFTRVVEPTSIALGEPASESLNYEKYPEDSSLHRVGHRFTAQAQEADQLPVTNYSSPLPTDPEKRTRRKAKNRRYNNQSSQVIKETPTSYNRVWSTHRWKRLPALPAAQSDIVLIGEVTDAQAYLSDDKTGIYSEFTIRVDEALKNDESASLYPGATVTAERFGGAVRFSSGAIEKHKISGQGMPRVGQKYLLFLKRTDQEQDFLLITGYALRGGRVFPLDGAEGRQKLPFNNYSGTEVPAFLQAVRDAIAQAAQSSSGERK